MKQEVQDKNEEMTMEEILSSIRSIISEDQSYPTMPQKVFKEGQETNPSGARPLSELPKFKKENPKPPGDSAPRQKEEVVQKELQETFFSDDSLKHSVNEVSLGHNHKQPELPPVENRSQKEDRVADALKKIVAGHALDKSSQKESLYTMQGALQSHEKEEGEGRLQALLQNMLEKVVLRKTEQWLDEKLPSIIEKIVIKELEKIILRMGD